ncbi:MAG: hypothetical protein LBP81_05370 [Treponema sp.]|jgi:hypothetical protein|nr:hypothetical protein [Treponema sp.]
METTSHNTFLIRDIAGGEKEGYEFDRSGFYTKANWWFWGNITPSFLLDAELGVWEIDHPLYQANSFGANIPETSWGDGIQGLGSIFFSPVYGLNAGKIPGILNKMAFTLGTPFLNVRFGYGNLEKAAMSSFTGVYNMLDPWQDVGRGFNELSVGEKLKSIGDAIKLDALIGFSRMRAEYGVYSYISGSFFDKVTTAFTFGSTSNAAELFRYNEQNDNAYSFFASYRPLESLTVSIHGLSAFGTNIDPGLEASAAAVGTNLTLGLYDLKLSQSFAGPQALTVWGDDDTVNPDSVSTSAVQWVNINDLVRFGLDTNLKFNTIDALRDGLVETRNQPMVDLNFSGLAGLDMALSFYTVLNVNRIAYKTDMERPWAFNFEEAGLELGASNIAAYVRKMVFSYALAAEYKEWAGDAYALDRLYHSLMLNWDLTESLSVTCASLIRSSADEDVAFVPFGFAAGVSLLTNIKAIGKPRVWMHFTYAMDPYEDNNYSLYRYDDPDNGLKHRSYRLNHLYDFVDKSRISFGLIWDL